MVFFVVSCTDLRVMGFQVEYGAIFNQMKTGAIRATIQRELQITGLFRPVFLLVSRLAL